MLLQAYLGKTPPSAAVTAAGGTSSALVAAEEAYPSTPRLGGNLLAGGEAAAAPVAAAPPASAAVPPQCDSLGIEMMQLSTELLKRVPELLAPHRLKLLTLTWKYTKVWGGKC